MDIESKEYSLAFTKGVQRWRLQFWSEPTRMQPSLRPPVDELSTASRLHTRSLYPWAPPSPSSTHIRTGRADSRTLRHSTSRPFAHDREPSSRKRAAARTVNSTRTNGCALRVTHVDLPAPFAPPSRCFGRGSLRNPHNQRPPVGPTITALPQAW